ncbi:hypothetical protein [Mycobacterium sp. 48b]|uniref:hypothetical protein n=1 Tax=Mycobacterium sp. 48b TaxID=3400426 RepID=UPI003AAEF597
MSGLTPERIRDAAEVLETLASRFNNPDPGLAVFSAHTLRGDADHLEREQAEEAKREKRVGDLAAELRGLYSTPTAAWSDIARALLERYPALADPGPCDKGPCCLANHHEGRCEL